MPSSKRASIASLTINGAALTGVQGRIVDPSGAVWTLRSSVLGGLGIYRNGVFEQHSANVIKLVLFNGKISQKNRAGRWFGYANGTWIILAGDPRTPVSSANTAVTRSSGYIVDRSHNVWTLATLSAGTDTLQENNTVSDGLHVYENGGLAGTTANVTLLLWYGGQIYCQENNSQWFQWTGSGWTTINADPRTTQPPTPVPAPTPSPSPSPVPSPSPTPVPTPTPSGRSWYVDNSVGSNGDGTSWGTAWNSLGNINWNSIAGGDAIYISGGPNGQTYNETLTVGADGNQGAPILITGATDAGHSGTVTIDAQATRSYCVAVGSHNWITVQNLTVQNNNGANVSVRGSSAGVVIQNIVSHTGMGTGNGADCRAYDFRNCVASTPGVWAVVMQNCTADTPSSTTSQTDTVWSSGNNGVLIQNNILTIANTDGTGHSDTFQSNVDISVTFRNNVLSHPNGGSNNHGIIVADILAGGTMYFYNNTIYMGSGPGSPTIAIIRQNVVSNSNTGVTKFWNNTIINAYQGYNAYTTTGALPSGDEFKNNIIYTLAGATPYILSSNPAPGNIDYNCVYLASGANFNWSNWQSQGWDTHGINADPRFTNLANQDLTLLSGSPCIGAGTQIPQVTMDIIGTPRPSGPYTIGAYEG